MASKVSSKGAVTAKRVAAGVKNMWDSAKRDFTDNSPYVIKQDFMDLLDYAKSKSQLLKRSSLSGPSEINSQLEKSVNVDVGAELLSKYKEVWGSIHSQTQSSSVLAATLDSEIETNCNTLSKSHGIIQRCQDEFSNLPDTLEAVEKTQRKVDSLMETLKNVEENIVEFCRVKSQLESERKKHSIKIQFEKHCVEEDNKIEQVKSALAKERQETIDLKKELEAKDIAERQKTFQTIFNEQMANYRQNGEVERPITAEVVREGVGSHLEDVFIDDEDGVAPLDEFLSDVILEESDTKIDENPAVSPVEDSLDIPEQEELDPAEDKS